jgi:hypothetical protein
MHSNMFSAGWGIGGGSAEVEKSERQLVEDACAVSARICRCIHGQALEGPDFARKRGLQQELASSKQLA